MACPVVDYLNEELQVGDMVLGPASSSGELTVSVITSIAHRASAAVLNCSAPRLGARRAKWFLRTKRLKYYCPGVDYDIAPDGRHIATSVICLSAVKFKGNVADVGEFAKLQHGYPQLVPDLKQLLTAKVNELVTKARQQ